MAGPRPPRHENAHRPSPAGLNASDEPALDAADVAASRTPLEFKSHEGEVGNTLQAYLREIRRAPLLTPQEEF